MLFIRGEVQATRLGAAEGLSGRAEAAPVHAETSALLAASTAVVGVRAGVDAALGAVREPGRTRTAARADAARGDARSGAVRAGADPRGDALTGSPRAAGARARRGAARAAGARAQIDDDLAAAGGAPAHRDAGERRCKASVNE